MASEERRAAWRAANARHRKRHGATHRATHTKDMRERRRARPERHILANMIQRCHNPKHPKFRLYGGAGVRVCDEWRGHGGFDRFFAHVGPRPSAKHSIDRFPNREGNYEPGNVRWATQREQMRNTRMTRRLTVHGREVTRIELAEMTGLDRRTIDSRIARGMSPEEAIAKRGIPHRRLITVNGVTRNAVEWSRHLGGYDSLVAVRLYQGMTELEAVTTPHVRRRPRQ